jgi:hypothetical protein
MGCPAAVNDCELEVAIIRDIRWRGNLVPHRGCSIRSGGNTRFDLGQEAGTVGQPTWVRRHMERFVRRENVKHYRELLKTAKDETERQRILRLLAEEQQKQKDAGDKIEE